MPLKNFFSGYNWFLLILMLILSTLGLINLYSATNGNASFFKQLYLVCGGSIFVILASFNLSTKGLERYSYYFYGIVVILLITVLINGHLVGGSKRWLDLYAFRFQPSEVAKIAMAMAIAKYLARDKIVGAYQLRNLVRPGLLIAGLFILVNMQPDLGTSGIIALVALSQLALTRIDRRSVLIVSLIAPIALGSAWLFVLKDYQKQRVLTFISPKSDPLDKGYHSRQSMIAVGSGRKSGKGFQKGTQTHLQFLPERHTDFIFSVLAEEHGLVGAATVLALLLFFLMACVGASFQARDIYGFYLGIGLTATIFWQVIINVAMVLGSFPIVGMTLPFFSYGGTSIMTVLASVGILLNISHRGRQN